MEWNREIINMKWIAISLTVLIIILAALWLAIGGSALAIALSILSAVTIALGVFSLGIWYAHQSIQLGAKLATEAQNNNDRWDSVKMQSLAHFGGEIFKLKGSNQAATGFPLLESSNDTFDASFTIAGIEDE
jgi:hypothetical protein